MMEREGAGDGFSMGRAETVAGARRAPVETRVWQKETRSALRGAAVVDAGAMVEQWRQRAGALRERRVGRRSGDVFGGVLLKIVGRGSSRLARDARAAAVAHVAQGFEHHSQRMPVESCAVRMIQRLRQIDCQFGGGGRALLVKSVEELLTLLVRDGCARVPSFLRGRSVLSPRTCDLVGQAACRFQVFSAPLEGMLLGGGLLRRVDLIGAVAASRVRRCSAADAAVRRAGSPATDGASRRAALR